MIELKRLKLINWHNFENVTFDCARLTYMIGVNAVGKTTILDAIRYCLTTNRNFNALGNKKSGRTLQGSVHAKQRGENAYRRPGHTVASIHQFMLENNPCREGDAQCAYFRCGKDPSDSRDRFALLKRMALGQAAP